jgi:Cache domain
MLRTTLFGLAASLTLALINTQALAQSGTAAEARAMLDKAVVAVKADKAKAIDTFNKGEGGFKDRDLYPFCFQISDGKLLAAPERVRGQDARTLKDATGKVYGEDVYKVASQEGKVNEVSYMFPKPGESTPSAKTSFITKVGDLGCGVGYYK